MYQLRKKSRWIGMLTILVLLFQMATAGMVMATGITAEPDPANVERISGADRYLTAIEASKTGWESAEHVVLARGSDFADALASGPLAGVYNAPILLTPTNYLPDAVLTELERLNASHVFIVGGYGAVSEAVENRLKDEGFDTTRLNGSNRYGTALAIAQAIADSGQPIDTVHLASGSAGSFADALSISGVATMRGEPILLVTKMALPAEAEMFFAMHDIENTFIVGGTGVIDDGVFAGLPNPERLAGANRYLTNLRVLERFAGLFQSERIFSATGRNFPDALTGGVLAARFSAPLWLLGVRLEAEADAYLKSIMSVNTRVFILGGVSAIPDSLMDAVGGRVDHWQEVIVVVVDAETAIADLPPLASLALENKAAVMAARALVDQALALDPDAVIEGLADLEAAEEKIAALEADLTAAQAVEALIDGLPAVAALTLGDKNAVDAARAAYEGLTEAQKALVGNLSVLEAAETRISEMEADLTAAQAVEAQIDALPNGPALTLADKGAV